MLAGVGGERLQFLLRLTGAAIMNWVYLLVLAVGLAFTSAPAHAAPDDKRVALIIGNDAYKGLKRLDNGVNDARAMAAELKALGFETIVKTNAGRKDMHNAIGEFGGKLASGSVGLFYYAGHGIQSGDRNFLIPVDADLQSEDDLDADAIDVGKVMRAMEAARNKLNIVVLDACRDNPLPKGGRSGTRGLAVVQAPTGTLVAYATGPGKVAQDGDKGGNGVYTGELLKALREPGLKIEDVFKKAGAGVAEKTGGKQVPWMQASISGDFYLRPGAAVAAAQSSGGTDKETVFWQSIQGNTDPEMYKAYLRQWPDGTFAAIAKAKVESLKGTKVAAVVPPRPEPVLEAVDKDMVARSAVRVREAPNAQAKVVQTLKEGSEVLISEKVKGDNWGAVEQKGKRLGYAVLDSFEDAASWRKRKEEEGRSSEQTAVVAPPAPAPSTLVTPVGLRPPPTLPPAQLYHPQSVVDIYVHQCVGCHGINRKGAIGKNIEPPKTQKLGQARIEAVIANGTDGGMPSFSGKLSPAQISSLATFIQEPVPAMPQDWTVAQARSTWELRVPPSQRPTSQSHGVRLDNVFAVTLRDAGEVALIDGDSKKIWTRLAVGAGIHLAKPSQSGRYLYSHNRDCRVAMTDLWQNPPSIVASVKVGYDCRSLEVSKAKGYEDRYIIVGGYFPPQYTVLDGQTLEPIVVSSTRGNTIDGQYHSEPRVAGILPSLGRPEWVVSVKETGFLKMVDYSNLNQVGETSIPAAKFLHDGGLDSSKRFALVAANASNKVAILDTQTRQLAGLVDVKSIPHGGRGANFVHPRFGPVWATTHLGADVISLIGTDPKGRPQYAWKVVAELKNHGGGALFVKTHPKSRNLWADAPLTPDREAAGSVTVYDIDRLDAGPTVINIAQLANLPQKKATSRAVQAEYSADGSEVWFSVWGGKEDDGAIVILDDRTRQLKAVIRDPYLTTPTAKFNLYNTRNDIY